MIGCVPGTPGISGGAGLVVLAGVAALCCLPVLASALPASVPELTPRQLENSILGSQRMSFSGYAESDATFGLPPLPAFASVTPLLDGVTRMRVWQASPDRWRVDTLSDTGENDTYQDGRQHLRLGLRRAAAHRDLRPAGHPAAQSRRPRCQRPWPSGSSMRRDRTRS